MYIVNRAVVTVIHPEFHHIDLDSLIEFYTKEATSLKEALLNGADWRELQDIRARVTQLEKTIHLRKLSGSNPAQEAVRES